LLPSLLEISLLAIVIELVTNCSILAKDPNLGVLQLCTMDLMYVKRKMKKVGSRIVLIPRPLISMKFFISIK
jgi:hypothetical protein